MEWAKKTRFKTIGELLTTFSEKRPTVDRQVEQSGLIGMCLRR